MSPILILERAAAELSPKPCHNRAASRLSRRAASSFAGVRSDSIRLASVARTHGLEPRWRPRAQKRGSPTLGTIDVEPSGLPSRRCTRNVEGPATPKRGTTRVPRRKRSYQTRPQQCRPPRARSPPCRLHPVPGWPRRGRPAGPSAAGASSPAARQSGTQLRSAAPPECRQQRAAQPQPEPGSIVQGVAHDNIYRDGGGETAGAAFVHRALIAAKVYSGVPWPIRIS